MSSSNNQPKQLELYGSSTYAVGETVLTPLGYKTVLSFKKGQPGTHSSYKVDVNGRDIWVRESDIQRPEKTPKPHRRKVSLTSGQKDVLQLTFYPCIQSASNQNRFIDTIRQSLVAIQEAYSKKDIAKLNDAIAAYDQHYLRARRNGITAGSIRKKCRRAYLGCISWNMNKAIVAVTDGNPVAVLKHMAWMEADRERALTAGFSLKEINTKPPKLECGTTNG